MANPGSPGTGYRFKTSAERDAEAKARRSRNGKRAGVLLGIAALVLVGAVWNPPTGTTHSFTSASDYKSSSNSGCTNSGRGCHGTETSYRSFNAYHPGTKCQTCHDGVQGVACIPCHVPNSNHECQTCHDGSMTGASDAGNLSGSYPNGHYHETSHTALGTDYTTLVYATQVGAAKAPCSQCHSRDLKTAHTGVAFAEKSAYHAGQGLNCAQCHNDARSGALAAVQRKWKARKCEDCHSADAPAPMHSDTVARAVAVSSDDGCVASGPGCHDARNLHQLHADKPARCTGSARRGEPGCHPTGVEAAITTATACGGSGEGACHRFVDAAHYSASHHTASGDDFRTVVRGAGGGSAGATCDDCHSADLALAHTGVAPAPGSPYGPTVECRECHNDVRSGGFAAVDPWPSRTCGECHDVAGSAPEHSLAVAPPVTAVDSGGCAGSGPGCHESANLHAIHAGAAGCGGSAKAGEPGCHTLSGSPDVPQSRTCGAPGTGCHQAAAGGTFQHSGPGGFVHSPTSNVPASDKSYYGVECGSCHRMQPDGVSLVDEHSLPTSAKSLSANVCLNCHEAPAAAETIAARWPRRDTAEACTSCHGSGGLPAPHLGDTSALHTPPSDASSGCASSGPGCHPTGDLAEVGPPSVSANIHASCLRCHDWRRANSDGAYDPAAKTCGSGRACHGVAGQYDATTSVHDGAAGRVDGTDAAHTATPSQPAASFVDTASGVSTRCDACHSTALATEHSRVSSVLATASPNLCRGCHDFSLVSAKVVKAGWPSRTSTAACDACHAGSGIPAAHSLIATAMAGRELSTTGAATPGFCVRSGCHVSSDLRVVHKRVGCTIWGCHQATGDIDGRNRLSCGGAPNSNACHRGFSATNHGVDHTALPTGESAGTSQGVSYDVGSNVGCFGCHFSDLAEEHANAFEAGQVRGNPAQSNACETCHYDPADPTRNPNANLPGVRAAISNHDRRCVACHASGSAADGPTYVASPHRQTTTTASWDATANIPPGRVWTDPAVDWRTALDATTGGGHNALPASAVGASGTKAFPVTTFTAIGSPPATYRWSLPANAGTTLWLRAGPLVSPTGTQTLDEGWSVGTTSGVQAAHVTCAECHELPATMTGPQGAAATIYIADGYSATEYSNPTSGTYQFDPYNRDPSHPANPAGYKPVICYKCHTLFSGSVPGTLAPGGNARHSLHKWWSPGATMPAYCVDCHAAIPHAWRRPRLLVRTAVVATDTAPVDAWPYRSARRPGLAGIRLANESGSANISPGACAVVPGGCHDNAPTLFSHPDPATAQTAGWSYWP